MIIASMCRRQTYTSVSQPTLDDDSMSSIKCFIHQLTFLLAETKEILKQYESQ